VIEHLYTDEELEIYQEQFNPLRTDRQMRRRRKPQVRHVPKKSRAQIVAEIADTAGLEGGFNITYQPSRHEREWLLSSLRFFYDQSLITDVLALVKGGKEASVYCCRADPSTGVDLLAVKVYRPQKFRTLRNDAMYRRGREILMPGGRPVGREAEHIARAIRNKTAYGAQAQHTSWLMYEYTTLERLHRAGGDVPQPIAASENAILMSYHGDEQMAAPTLNEISLEPDEAGPLFQAVMRNVELMLQHNLVHGDLSAYNVLYWGGEITVIDFPQVVNLHTNNDARSILARDIQRTCEYFARQGARRDPAVITDELWHRYHPDETSLRDQIADYSRFFSQHSQEALT